VACYGTECSFLQGGRRWALLSSAAARNNVSRIGVHTLMLPYLGPEILEWLLTWGARPEDGSSSEQPTAPLSHESTDNKTTGEQMQ
jgi:hypothetical protein